MSENKKKPKILLRDEIPDDGINRQSRATVYVMQNPPVVVIAERSDPPSVLVQDASKPHVSNVFIPKGEDVEIRTVPSFLEGVRFFLTPIRDYFYQEVAFAVRDGRYEDAIKMIKWVQDGNDPGLWDESCVDKDDSSGEEE